MPPTNEERLASIEAHLSHLADSMQDLNKTISTIMAPEVAALRRDQNNQILELEKVRSVMSTIMPELADLRKRLSDQGTELAEKSLELEKIRNDSKLQRMVLLFALLLSSGSGAGLAAKFLGGP